MSEFSEYLKYLRKKKGFTLVALAKAAKTSDSFLSQLENEKRNPPKARFLLNLAEALGESNQEISEVYGHLMRTAGYFDDRPWIESIPITESVSFFSWMDDNRPKEKEDVLDEIISTSKKLILDYKNLLSQHRLLESEMEELSKQLNLELLFNDDVKVLLNGTPLGSNELLMIRTLINGILSNRKEVDNS